MKALHLTVVCAALFVLGIFVGGCGNGEPSASRTSTAADRGGPNAGGNGGDDGGSSSDSTDGEERSLEGCPESGGCTASAYLYTDPDGRPFLCTDLKIILIEVPNRVSVAPVSPPVRSMTVPLTVTGVQTAVTTPTTTSEQHLAGRPVCRQGAKAIPVKGVDLDAIGELKKSEDGKTSWTPEKIRLSGRIVNGEFVVDD